MRKMSLPDIVTTATLGAWISKVRQGAMWEAVRGGIPATNGGPGTLPSGTDKRGGKADTS